MRLEERVRQSAKRHPEREALRVGAVSVSYRELVERAEQWAGSLMSAAPDPGIPHRVGVLAHRTLEGYVGLLAALCAGASVVPLSPDWPAKRLAAALTACRLSSLVADEGGLATIAGAEHAFSGLPVLAPGRRPGRAPGLAAGGDSGMRLMDDRPERQAGPAMTPPSPETIAYILFTSGSTGRAKGVPISHRNIDSFLHTVFARYDFDADDVFSQNCDLTFDLSFFDLFIAWSCGATVVHTPISAIPRLGQFVQDNGLTVWLSVPSVIPLAQRAGELRDTAMPSLRWSFFCGEPLVAADAAAWGLAAPGSVIENLYGPTEVTIACSSYRWSGLDDPAVSRGIVPIGMPFPGLDHLLLDETGQVTHDQGELCVTGPQMLAGYLDSADDENRFVDCRDRRWYRTGDIVRQSHDTLLYVGRIDDQIKMHGYRVELGEIEHRLRQVPGVTQAVVVAVGTALDHHLVAFHSGRPAPSAELVRLLAAELPHYMIPRKFVWLDRLPENDRGKIDRRALNRHAEDMRPAGQQ